MDYPTASPPRAWATRIAESAVARILVAALCLGVPFVLLNLALKLFAAEPEMVHLRNGLKVVVLVAAYLGYVRWVEKRSPFELSLPGAAKEISVGFLVGGSLIGLSVAMLAAFGSYRSEGINADVTWFRYIAGFFAVAMLEELIFRAVLFRLIERSLGSVVSMILSAALFGLAHLLNPSATWISTASLSLVSLIFVGGFLLTRRLWLCVGLHWGWNLVQALCSLPVSGGITKGLLNAHISGPAWLTGGNFGLEASVVTLLLALVTASVLLAMARKKGHFIAPYWRRRLRPPGA